MKGDQEEDAEASALPSEPAMGIHVGARPVLPPLPARYRAALEAAVGFTVDRWQPVGILASGSIVRGNPGPESDLDIFVLHQEPVRQRVQKRFEGVPAELFVNPPEQIRRCFEQERRDGRGRPSTVHMFATGVAVRDPEGIVARLQQEAQDVWTAGPEVTDQILTAKRYAVACWLEDALDIRTTDPEMCAALLSTAVLEAVRFRYWLARLWQPRQKELLDALVALDPTLAELARRFQRAAALDERVALAREVVARSAGETGFFEWESAVETVAPDGGEDSG